MNEHNYAQTWFDPFTRRRFLETLEHRGKGDPGKGASGLGMASLSKT
jgi:hypothetical protein